MANGPLNLNSPEQLIAAYRETIRQRTVARTCVSLAVLGVVVIYVFMIWNTVMQFKNERLPDFARALGVQFASLTPKMTAQVGGMVERLYPEIQAAVHQKASQNWPAIEGELHNQMLLLAKFAESRWPLIQQGIVQLIQLQRAAVHKELKDILDEDDAESISEAYGAALQKKYEDIVAMTLGSYGDVLVKNAKEIGNVLNAMADKESKVRNPKEMQEILGILLELAGVHLQQNL